MLLVRHKIQSYRKVSAGPATALRAFLPCHSSPFTHFAVNRRRAQGHELE
jgi:hypothetical protein